MTSHYLLNNKLWTEFKQHSDIEFSAKIYALTRHDDSGLTERIQAGFKLISPEEHLQIERKWLINPEDRFFTEQDKLINLTNQDKTYLSKLGALKMGYLNNWPPMEFQGKNGEFLGVNADIKNLLVNHLGLSIIPVAFDTFDEMMHQLKSGEIQLVASLAQHAERGDSVSVSDVYWPSPWAIASDLSQPAILNISQLNNKKISVIKGYQLVSQLRQQFPNVTLILVEDTQTGLDSVVNGQADMFIEKVTALADQLKDGQFPSLKLSLIADLADQHSRIGVFNDLSELLPLINRVLQTIDKEKQQQLYQKWIEVDVSTKNNFYQRWMNWLILGMVLVCLVTITVFAANRRLNIEIKCREDAEHQLIYLANHDNVTGLANRTSLDKQLATAIEKHQATKSKFALLFIDLDGFKIVNDQHGHHIGDALLIKVSQLLNDSILTKDTIARFGGDEFVVLLSHIDSVEVAKRIAEVILDKLESVTRIDDKFVQISASIGIAVYPQDGVSPHDLIKHADHLMYQAKRIGGHQYKSSF
ncbi:diguanylate cyclase domain-containing protein [Shewanella aestuarii]|uniref:Diguanylate cyclase n=1 Tax=Shewanella aestuarii TaxID=1028752 RepID=A0A6G9QKT7_9GAMM|nr:diguanylate cyclase [Shewanella aestuarii]QIR14479.1 diguanylate cyclase [Shewanella aestuarii]